MMEERKKKKVIINTIPVAKGVASEGVNVYLKKLLKNIPHSHRSRITLVVTSSNKKVFGEIEGYSCFKIPISVKARFMRIIIHQLVLPVVLTYLKGDVLFEPLDICSVFSPLPTVTCVHNGLIFKSEMGNSRLMYDKLMMQISAVKSERIITTTEYVKRSFVQEFRVNTSKIGVVYHGGGIVEDALKSGWSSYDSGKCKGVLFVSTLHPHKNADNLIRAYSNLARRRSEIGPLVIVGGDTDRKTPTDKYSSERKRLRALAENLGVEESVQFMGRISDEKLLTLFKRSKLMVFPSSLEGFGLPALEAMMAGLPLIASNRASVPEVVDGGGLIVDPDDVETMAEKMEAVLFDDSLHDRLTNAARERGREFSWEKTACQTLRVLDTVV